jgi:hypothetical protein
MPAMSGQRSRLKEVLLHLDVNLLAGVSRRRICFKKL